jgi:dTDP-glucose 4,6-dehydratase
MTRVLLTGIGGFIGAHCLEYFLQKTDWKIIGIDSFRHKGNYSRLNSIADYDPKRVVVFNHDLSVPIDGVLENQILERNIHGEASGLDYIINMASDSAVERSVTNPLACLRNNYDLVINMLEFAKRVRPKVFVQISTDEVYGEAYDQPHKEWDVIMPSNPYAASKAAQEAVAISYWRSYNMPIIITNTMNCIGERQDTEKFLPRIIWKVATDQVMEIYGELGNIGSRYYLHCKNMADALIFLCNLKPAMYTEGARRPDRYNVVGDICLDNLEVAQLVAKYMGKELKYKLVPSESARPGYDRRYALDGSKMEAMGWKPPIPTLQAIKQVVEWTLAHPHWLGQ